MGRPNRTAVSNSKPLSPNAPVAVDDEHPLVGVGDLGGEGERHAHPQGAERARVHPGAPIGDPQHLGRLGDDVATVADHDHVGSDSTTSAIAAHRRSGSIGTSSLPSWAASCGLGRVLDRPQRSDQSECVDGVPLRHQRLAQRVEVDTEVARPGRRRPSGSGR
jgi:hypothetical protein